MAILQESIDSGNINNIPSSGAQHNFTIEQYRFEDNRTLHDDRVYVYYIDSDNKYKLLNREIEYDLQGISPNYLFLTFMQPLESGKSNPLPYSNLGSLYFKYVNNGQIFDLHYRLETETDQDFKYKFDISDSQYNNPHNGLDGLSFVFKFINTFTPPTEQPPTEQPPTEQPPTEQPPDEILIDQNICFLAGSLVKTDKGRVAIDKINKKYHTIRGKRILYVTKSISSSSYIIRIQKNSLGNNYPSKTTYLSHTHKIHYYNRMIKSYELLHLFGVDIIPYHGETMYNILLDSYSRIEVNNLICETLHPNHILGLLYSNMNIWNQNQINVIIRKINQCLKIHNTQEYYDIIKECKQCIRKRYLGR